MATVIAHRGASARAPENTVAALDLALACGADVLEIDLRLTSDGVPIALHDETLERTAGDPRLVAALRAGELAAVPEPVRPPALSDLFERYGAGTRYLLDLKDPGAALVRAVTALVAIHGLADRVQVQTFDKRALRHVRRLAPSVGIAQLYPALLPPQAIQRDLARVARFACTIGPYYEAVTPALVAAAHHRGLRVQPWTVNDPVEMDRLLALGVDGLITDRPELAVDCRARHAEAPRALAAA